MSHRPPGVHILVKTHWCISFRRLLLVVRKTHETHQTDTCSNAYGEVYQR